MNQKSSKLSVTSYIVYFETDIWRSPCWILQKSQIYDNQIWESNIIYDVLNYWYSLWINPVMIVQTLRVLIGCLIWRVEHRIRVVIFDKARQQLCQLILTHEFLDYWFIPLFSCLKPKYLDGLFLTLVTDVDQFRILQRSHNGFV